MSCCMRAAAPWMRTMSSRLSASRAVASAPLQPVAEGADLAQGLLEVVRGDRGEVLQLAVAALELLPGALEIGLARFACLMSRAINE